MVDYIAFIHKDRKSGYGVSFPDLPGVVTVADTLEGVRKEAEEALALHVEGMVEDGDTPFLPPPRWTLWLEQTASGTQSLWP